MRKDRSLRFFCKMIAIFGAPAVLLIGVIAAWVARRYYCKRRDENNDRGEPNEVETPLDHIIKISHTQRGHLSKTFFNVYDSKRNTIDSNGAKEMKRLVQEAKPVSSEEAQIVSVKPPLQRRRISTRIWSPASCSSEVLQAQIEANHPRAIAPSSHEASGVQEKYLARTLICSRSIEAIRFTDEDDRFNLSRPAPIVATQEESATLWLAKFRLRNRNRTGRF